MVSRSDVFAAKNTCFPVAVALADNGWRDFFVKNELMKEGIFMGNADCIFEVQRY